MSALGLLLVLAAVAPSAACVYLLVLTLCSARMAARRRDAPRTRFDVIVPAHDEEPGIGATIASLLAVAYPRELFRVVVVADNCSDGTETAARRAGATVLSRVDAGHPGKGRALAYAFEETLPDGSDAVVVVDADTVVSPNLLAAFDARLGEGAVAVQCDYAVRNAGASWRTRLMAVALGSFHTLRSLGRERLDVSCGLRGNGMCFTRALLREVPHDAFSIVEDVEYGVRLGQAGHRVVHAPEAHVYGEMVAGERASRSQRRRWEGGRARMRRQGWSLLVAAARGMDGVLLDLGMDLLVPPVGTLALLVGLGGAATCAAVMAGAGGAGAVALAMWGFCGVCLVAYVARGWQLSGTGARGLLSLLHVPAYILWKLVLAVRGDRVGAGWVRTTRAAKAGATLRGAGR